ncbi:uncharacterized protein [Apostichopus japonicus]|uniref:uncharacterized protein isoform X7 n=1 Tax=Stichopus japonicus TaxID=307972 RepID=UPI003AB1F1C4
MLPWEIYCSNYSIGTSARHQWRIRARDEKTLPADPSLDDVSAEPQLRAHAYWMLGVIKFSEGRRPTKFPPEGVQTGWLTFVVF